MQVDKMERHMTRVAVGYSYIPPRLVNFLRNGLHKLIQSTRVQGMLVTRFSLLNLRTTESVTAPSRSMTRLGSPHKCVVGVVYHLINPPGTTLWEYESKTTANVIESRSLLVALQVAVMEPVLHESLGDRLAEVRTGYSNRFHENMTCRVWVKEALSDLDGYG
ncbi:hypothetical protein EMCG_01569 [[Emmonsia] crescens]|uniref:Uncharacterized protein n=1 Tax=[Emmonsia] crescens TaxID=73230 RepID=A0A0G2I138_9EURO|nr:hypothetical protein EMCG_01569 [Emmonsia crescens UAMH 3008]